MSGTFDQILQILIVLGGTSMSLAKIWLCPSCRPQFGRKSWRSSFRTAEEGAQRDHFIVFVTQLLNTVAGQDLNPWYSGSSQDHPRNQRGSDFSKSRNNMKQPQNPGEFRRNLEDFYCSQCQISLPLFGKTQTSNSFGEVRLWLNAPPCQGPARRVGRHLRLHADLSDRLWRCLPLGLNFEALRTGVGKCPILGILDITL